MTPGPELTTKAQCYRSPLGHETGVGLPTEEVPFYQFFFLTDIRLLHGFPRDKFRCKTLRGSKAYCYLVVFTTWQTHWDAVSHIVKATGTKDDTPDQLYLIPNPAQQYLVKWIGNANAF